MLNFFKRPAPDADTRATKPSGRRTSTQAKKTPRLPDPIPVPEVVEGNEESDWALWEDSVAFQDSQMPSGFGDLKAPEIRESSKDKPVDPHDPFGSVRRRAP
jgi:hypothetical protein